MLPHNLSFVIITLFGRYIFSNPIKLAGLNFLFSKKFLLTFLFSWHQPTIFISFAALCSLCYWLGQQQILDTSFAAYNSYLMNIKAPTKSIYSCEIKRSILNQKVIIISKNEVPMRILNQKGEILLFQCHQMIDFRSMHDWMGRYLPRNMCLLHILCDDDFIIIKCMENYYYSKLYGM